MAKTIIIMQPEEKDVDKSISEKLIEDENNDAINQHQRKMKLLLAVNELLLKEDVNVGEWGFIVEHISEKIGYHVSLIKINSIIK